MVAEEDRRQQRTIEELFDPICILRFVCGCTGFIDQVECYNNSISAESSMQSEMEIVDGEIGQL